MLDLLRDGKPMYFFWIEVANDIQNIAEGTTDPMVEFSLPNLVLKV